MRLSGLGLGPFLSCGRLSHSLGSSSFLGLGLLFGGSRGGSRGGH